MNEAVDDLAANGYDSAERVAYWEERIRRAAEAESGPSVKMDEMLREVLRRTYERLASSASTTRAHPGIGRFTIERVRPALRAELDRRIMASANLIRLRKKQRVAETLARFSGWSTSLPKGGSAEPEKREAKASIKKPIANLPFEERRVLIDQGHKLFSSLNEVIAEGGGAIAGVWHSRFRQPGYNFREDHKERDGLVYLLPESWALREGLVKVGLSGKTDSITKPAEEPFCRCSYVYLYSLRDIEKLAPELLTAKGRARLAEARAKIKAG